MLELRWTFKTGRPNTGWIPIGEGAQAIWQVLEYRTQVNILEVGLQEVAWSDWTEVGHQSSIPENLPELKRLQKEAYQSSWYRNALRSVKQKLRLV